MAMSEASILMMSICFAVYIIKFCIHVLLKMMYMSDSHPYTKKMAMKLKQNFISAEAKLLLFFFRQVKQQVTMAKSTELP